MFRLMNGIHWRSAVCTSAVCLLSSVLAFVVAPPFFTAQAQQPEPVRPIRFEGADPGRIAALAQALANDIPYVPGELLVRFKPGSEPRGQASALSVLKAEIRREQAEWIGDVLHVKGVQGLDPVRASEALARQPEVLYAQPNYIRPFKAVPNDSNYSQQWHFDAINLPRAWEINPGGRADVLIAVLDSGLTTTTDAFQFRIWNGRSFQLFGVPLSRAVDIDHARVREGREFAFDWRWTTSNGESVLFDASGHGSHVAGTIAQHTNNGEGFAGIAHASTILPLKVCWSYWDFQLVFGAAGIPGFVDPDAGGCPDDAQVAALRFAADNGVRVINMSLGGAGAAPAIADALRYAVGRGSFVSIAAGNEALDGNPTSYPAAYAPDIDGVVAVGAVNRALTRARYSNFGAYIELVAPGGDGGPSVNDVWQMAPLQSDLRFELLAPRFDRYQSYGSSGTSMAAPHVAGVAALLYSQGITNPRAIEAALKRFARDLGPPGRDDEYGFGLIDSRAALRGLGVAR